MYINVFKLSFSSRLLKSHQFLWGNWLRVPYNLCNWQTGLGQSNPIQYEYICYVAVVHVAASAPQCLRTSRSTVLGLQAPRCIVVCAGAVHPQCTWDQ